MAGESEKQERFQRKFGEDQVGKPFATDRDSVEEGQEREGTNLDLGEERSDKQQKEIQKARQERES